MLLFGVALIVLGDLPAAGHPAAAAYGSGPADGGRDRGTRGRCEVTDVEREAGSRHAGRSGRRAGVPDQVLTVDDITLRFGGLTALDQVTFDIKQGEILGLIGPNGAGKTTCFNVMTGVYQPTSGTIRFQGQSLQGLKRLPDHQARHRPHVPEHPTVQGDDRPRERHGRSGRRVTVPELDLGALPTASAPPGRERGARRGDGVAPLHGSAQEGRRARGESLLWRPASAGDRSRDGHQADPALPGRTRCRVQSGREVGP